jgi:hypothetical protein
MMGQQVEQKVDRVFIIIPGKVLLHTGFKQKTPRLLVGF